MKNIFNYNIIIQFILKIHLSRKNTGKNQFQYFLTTYISIRFKI